MSADDGREFELARSRTLARELVEIARSRALAWELGCVVERVRGLDDVSPGLSHSLGN